MSLSLLKRSIAIVEEDLPNTKKKKGNKSASLSASSQSKSSLHSLIPEKQKLFGKFRDRRGNEVRYEKLDHQEKLSLDDLRRSSAQEATKTEKNIEKLLRISSKKLDPKIATKLLGHAKRKQRSNRNDDEEEEPKEQKSIFTEEDFKKFEKEYFVQ